MTQQSLLIVGVMSLGFVLAGCNTAHKVETDNTVNVKVDPIEVKPIYATVDINIKVDRELDDFFEFEDDIDAVGKADDGGAQ